MSWPCQNLSSLRLLEQVGAAGIGKVLHAVEANQRLLAIPTDEAKCATGDLGSEGSAADGGLGERSTLKSHLEDFRAALAAGEAPNMRLVATPSHTCYLKIAEGCRKRCSFCIIPKIKGPLRSKSVDQVMPSTQSARTDLNP